MVANATRWFSHFLRRVAAIPIKAALRDPRCWLPGLAPTLATRFWSEAPPGIEPAAYTTAAWLALPQQAARLPPIARLEFAGLTLSIEEAEPIVADRLAENGLSLASSAEASATIEALCAGLACLARLPSLSATVAAMVRSIHVLAPAAAGFDISHSDPAIPFSIFLSVPTGEEHCAWRTAESLVHEAMHLQLTLIERDVPLVRADTEEFGYSPWQSHARPLQGLLHGLYVFRVIDQMFALAEVTFAGDQATRRFIGKRRREIAAEIKAVVPLADARGLTTRGALFARHLLGHALSF